MGGEQSDSSPLMAPAPIAGPSEIDLEGGPDEQIQCRICLETDGNRSYAASITYTKGAVLSHGNLIANVAGASWAIRLYPSDLYISYLPLAHIYERANQIMVAYSGGASGFYQGDSMKLQEDMAVLKPIIFCSVPRLYNRIYAGVLNGVKSSGVLRERLFDAAYKAKKQSIITGKKPSQMWEKLVFGKIKEMLGGIESVTWFLVPHHYLLKSWTFYEYALVA